jgi:integrase
MAQVYDARARKRITRRFKTRSAAKLWRRDAIVAIRRGAVASLFGESLTVAGALDDLAAGMADGRILDRSGRRYRPSTIRSYEQIARDHLKPALGERRLADLHRRDVQQLVDELRAGGLAPSTVCNALDPLRVVCRRAKRDEIITVDPTKDLELPRGRGRRAPAVAVDRVEQLLAALPGHERATYAIYTYAGLRRGEAQALRVSDLDLDGNVIRVRRGWDQYEGEQPTKTEAGVRDVPLIGPLRVIVREWLLQSGRRGDQLLLGRTASDPFVPSTVRSRAHRAWQQAGLEPLSPHEGRHAATSFMLAAGIPIFEVQRYIGHSSIDTTADIYGHLVKGRERDAIRRLDALLEGRAVE